MKRLVLILTLFIPTLSFSQAFTKSDSVVYKYERLRDKNTLEVDVSVLDNSLTITWLGDCDEIEIIDQNGVISPRIQCENDTRLSISPPGDESLSIRFFCDDKVILQKDIRL